MDGITKSQFSVLNKLIKHASSNNPNRRTHFACMRIGKQVIFAQNKYEEVKSTKLLKKTYKYPFPHAEFELFHSHQSAHPKVVYVIRLSRKHELIESTPCLACQLFLKRMGVKYVICSTRNGVKKLSLQDIM